MSTATATRERHIIFSGPMVRAILDGSKTQTRSIAMFGCAPGDLPSMVIEPWPGEWIAWWTHGTTEQQMKFTREEYQPGDGIRCPRGAVGDRLWVRETWHDLYETYDGQRYTFRPNEACRHIIEYAADGEHPPRWNSPIHMPRWASRITLEITGVRVERLQDITEADAQAEGVRIPEGIDPSQSTGWRESIQYRLSFEALWNRINGAGSWASNPFVWVIEFKRVEVPPS